MELLGTAAAEKLGIELDQAQLDQFKWYYHEIADWNRRVNLTTVTGWEQVQTRHFLDSLAVSVALPPSLLSSGGKVLDLGSGAGFPGLPLKIAFPELELTLMDATAKKTAFLSHVTTVLGLDTVEVRTGRAEALAHDVGQRESYDAVVSRAVARLSALAELTLPFCRLGGLVVAQKGTGIEDELSGAKRAIETMGGSLKGVREVEAGDPGGDGLLVVLEKTGPTPHKYPRRAGVPAKRPI